MPGTTGDIIWKKLDPKTFELYNEHPEEAPTDAAQAAPSKEPKKLGAKTTDLDKAMFQHDLANYGPEVAQQRAIKHLHMRQLAEMDDELRNNPNVDVQSRMQELFDSGALRLDKNGDLFSPTVKLGPHANQRILEASRIWQPPTRDPEEEMSDQPTMNTGDLRGNIEQEIAQAKSGIGGESEE